MQALKGKIYLPASLSPRSNISSGLYDIPEVPIKVGDHLYDSVLSVRPIYGDDGVELPWSINWDSHRFVFSPNCEGRTRDVVLFELIAKAYRHERDIPEDQPLSDEQNATITEILLHHKLKNKSNAGKGRKRRLRFALATCGLLLLIAIAANYAYFTLRPQPPQPLNMEVTRVDLGVNLVAKHQLKKVAFPESPDKPGDFRPIALHPTLPCALVVQDSTGKVFRVEDGSTQEVATVSANIRRVQISPEGQYAVVVDWFGQIYFADILNGGSPIVIETGSKVTDAFHCGDGEIMWATEDRSVYKHNLNTGETRQIPEWVEAVPSPSRLGNVAFTVIDERGHKVVSVPTTPGRANLKIQLQPSHRLTAFDASDDGVRVVAATSDRRVFVYERGPNPNSGYELGEHAPALSYMMPPTSLWISDPSTFLIAASSTIHRYDFGATVDNLNFAGQLQLPRSSDGTKVSLYFYCWQPESNRYLAASYKDLYIWEQN